MMAWVITVEGLVLIKKITFGDQAAVNIAVFEINCCLSFMLNMSHFHSSPRTKGPDKDQKLAVAEDQAASLKGGMSLWLAVQCSCHLGPDVSLFWN